MAYILGFFTADGSMYRTNRKTHFIAIEITDKELLEKIRDVLGSNHKIGLRRVGHKKWKPIYRLQIGSKVIFDNLTKLGLTQNKSLTLPFLSVPKQFLGDFTRGYFDGDGCVQFGKYWRKDRNEWKWQLSTSFTSGSEKFLIGLFNVLKLLVCGGNVRGKKGGYELVFGQHDSIALFRFMYHNVPEGLFLERKHATFQKAFKILKVAGVV
ncbi:MAG: hypothetical protein A2946_02310 [Candidatus Liptonbacteria bacterium RIFCSPLOWO2_01_FULL_53_13]|uniref:DOD-type homing endonuclease domain-containing protein n=1 Tax=Candidatus Liptonbacteria bacterium RIFCSPLOWO2_01_FULL_53_13 TaxID=1798651 RepID=A0A1G2CIJ5_9BACT|nr:MAG: hypothetical protein A2946_02310 [Candidatus Liptonbacteria bacterium RIFCSPLOWO2_01_FULL_53_13]